MVSNLPAKRPSVPATSKSRGIQHVHVRVLQTKQGKRPVLVNRDVMRPALQQRVIPMVQPAQRDLQQPAIPQRPVLGPKLRWQEVLNVDTGKKKEQPPSEEEEIRKTLDEDEVIAKNIQIRQADDSWAQVIWTEPDRLRSAYIQMSRYSADGMRMIMEAQSQNKPLILKISTYGTIGYVREYAPQLEVPKYDRISPSQTTLKPKRRKFAHVWPQGFTISADNGTFVVTKNNPQNADERAFEKRFKTLKEADEYVYLQHLYPS